MRTPSALFARAAAGLLAAALLALSPGCADKAEEPGVVARVNGRPIMLRQIEFRHDIMNLYVDEGGAPQLSTLKHEYGDILADLIVQELVMQELEKRGLAVSDAEARAAEDEIRKDYPEGAFEQVLVEEYIDLTGWRQQLKVRLSMERFSDLVLRPMVTLDYQEAERYYKEHISDFYLPARQVFYSITGSNKDLVDKAAAALAAGESLEAVAGKFQGIDARKLKMREDRLPEAWKAALKGVAPGGASSTLPAQSGGHLKLVLLERVEGRVIEPSQAYPIVEKVLLESKLRKAFEEWIAAVLASSDIQVAHDLIAGRSGSEDEGEVSASAEANRTLHDTNSSGAM